ncbi:unnamed protein product [Cuscuta epithymum]|uniref:TOD1/MUCI70 glycosyltransferase-like domain-containing protein n=2 Tax=Cuscuta epithymum TaxID=186058 RepID=A0AAV0D9K3_9ASTE|nr:unnamed protein product [Cuscuta epithymum]
MATSIKPLFFHSKLLCISVLYLLTALSLALYTLLSPTAHCLFRSSPHDPIQTPLFSYNSSYGEHKHALPTTRPSCTSPVFFSDYREVVTEIKRLSRNSLGLGSGTLKYAHGERESFGGNLSTQTRFSYFGHGDSEEQVPCGFFKPFPVSKSDEMAMERCNGVVVVSAIFNDHDKIRQPKGIGSDTSSLVCFFMFVDDVTLDGLENYNLIASRKSKDISVGVWRVVKVATSADNKKALLYEDAAMNGVIPKYLVHRLFPNTKFSIWVDAKMQLVVDPLLLIHSLLVVVNNKEGVDMAISRHPIYVHTMEEAMATARWRKWRDVGALRMQMDTYCEYGLQPWTSNKPYPSDVPDSAVIIRKHSKASNLFSCLLFNELESFNPRDQLAFAYVRDLMKLKPSINMFEVEVFEQVAVEYRHNLKRDNAWARQVEEGPLIKMEGDTKCDRYLKQMWGESND